MNRTNTLFRLVLGIGLLCAGCGDAFKDEGDGDVCSENEDCPSGASERTAVPPADSA